MNGDSWSSSDTLTAGCRLTGDDRRRRVPLRAGVAAASQTMRAGVAGKTVGTVVSGQPVSTRSTGGTGS